MNQQVIEFGSKKSICIQFQKIDFTFAPPLSHATLIFGNKEVPMSCNGFLLSTVVEFFEALSQSAWETPLGFKKDLIFICEFRDSLDIALTCLGSNEILLELDSMDANLPFSDKQRVDSYILGEIADHCRNLQKQLFELRRQRVEAGLVPCTRFELVKRTMTSIVKENTKKAVIVERFDDWRGDLRWNTTWIFQRLDTFWEFESPCRDFELISDHYAVDESGELFYPEHEIDSRHYCGLLFELIQAKNTSDVSVSWLTEGLNG